jgi:hypothetical protein
VLIACTLNTFTHMFQRCAASFSRFTGLNIIASRGVLRGGCCRHSQLGYLDPNPKFCASPERPQSVALPCTTLRALSTRVCIGAHQREVYSEERGGLGPGLLYLGLGQLGP